MINGLYIAEASSRRLCQRPEQRLFALWKICLALRSSMRFDHDGDGRRLLGRFDTESQVVVVCNQRVKRNVTGYPIHPSIHPPRLRYSCGSNANSIRIESNAKPLQSRPPFPSRIKKKHPESVVAALPAMRACGRTKKKIVARCGGNERTNERTNVLSARFSTRACLSEIVLTRTQSLVIIFLTDSDHYCYDMPQRRRIRHSPRMHPSVNQKIFSFYDFRNRIFHDSTVSVSIRSKRKGEKTERKKTKTHDNDCVHRFSYSLLLTLCIFLMSVLPGNPTTMAAFHRLTHN